MFLRHRSARSAKPTKSSNLSQSSQSARSKGAKAVRWAVEALESRRLLTTLHGGDTLVFLNEDSNYKTYQAVEAFGNITAEVIGANVDGNNDLILENLPGTLDGAPINGGFALPPGATVVGPLALGTPNGVPLVTNPSDLAVQPGTGQMYALAIQVIPPAVMGGAATNAVYLMKIDKTSGTGAYVGTMMTADISSEILSAAGISLIANPNAEVSSITTAAFNPADGRLYFAVQTGSTAAGTGMAVGAEQLESIDVTNPNLTTAIGFVPGGFSTSSVTAMTFAPAPPNTLIATDGTNFQQIQFAAKTTSTVLAPMANVDGPITGLSYDSGNGKYYVITTSPFTTVPMVNEVYVVNPNTGASVDYGPLANNNDGVNPGGLVYDPVGNQLYTDDLVTNNLLTVSQINRTRSLSIFQIYISQSDGGSIVTAQSAISGAMTPYGAGINFDGTGADALNIINAQTGMRFMIPSPTNSGDALIGARTRTIVPGVIVDALIPMTVGTAPITFGAAPYAVGDTITSGIVSAVGTNVDQTLVSGPIMGDVDIKGNIDTMFAGWLLTGNADGEVYTPFPSVSDPGNFTVVGDIENLLVGAAIGTNADILLDKPNYVTGFDMKVGGTLGRVETFDSLVGNINAQESPTAPQMLAVYDETEIRDNLNPNPWNSDELTIAPGATPPPSYYYNYNDTFSTAQVLGAIPVTAPGTPAQAIVDGLLQANTIQVDKTDYYAVPLLAGQVITCQVVPTAPGPPIDLGVFNPDGTEIATDYNDVDQAVTENAFFRFTADRPGLYRFAVGDNGNTTFSTAYGALPGVTPYQLTIQGVGNLAVGAVLAVNNILDNVDPREPEPSFGVVNGDMGALVADSNLLPGQPAGAINAIMSIFNSENTVNVSNGNFRDITGGTLGLPNGGTPIDDPEIQVPNGSVGLISAVSTTGVLFFNYPTPAPVVPPAIGGDYQLIQTTSDMDVKLVADGSIGVIRGANIQSGTNFPGPAMFFVNHDNSPTPGHIDLIDTSGNLGSAAIGGPRIQTGPEGNVGYMRAQGLVFPDAFFGAAQSQETLYQPGESATITDDSGATIVITPTGTPSVPPTVGTSNPTPGIPVTAGTAQGGTTTTVTLAANAPNTNLVGDMITFVSGTGAGETGIISAYAGGVATLAAALITPPDTTTQYSVTKPVTVNPMLPQLSIIAYGVEGSGGVAIMNVTSTGGVTMTSKDSIQGQTVQIGEIDALGLGQGLVQSLSVSTNGSGQPPPPSPTAGASTGGSTSMATTMGSTSSTGTNAPTFYTGADTAGPKGRTQFLPNPPMLNPNSESPLNVIMQGTAQIGTFEVYGGMFSNIINNTVGGEIVNTIIVSVGTLASGGTIGLAQNHTGAALNGISPMLNPAGLGASGDGGLQFKPEPPFKVALATVSVINNVFPFFAVDNAIIEEQQLPVRAFTFLDDTNLSGMNTNPFMPALGPVITAPTVVTTTLPDGSMTTATINPLAVGVTEMGFGTIAATTGVGGIDALGMPNLPPNSPMLGNVGSIQGAILGPCFADGSIGRVVLGALGIAPSGSGAVSQAGLYAMGQIGVISNSAPADIRGNIISAIGITGINLKHGSIINANIGDLEFTDQSTDISATHTPLNNTSPITNPTLDVGNIIVTGNGGIIGTAFRGDHFGQIDVAKGFGIFDSVINNNSGLNTGDATVAAIIGDGYGIRGVTFEGGQSIGKIIATGNGKNVSTQVYSPDVRFSEVDSYDPFFGLAPGPLTDIDFVTGATAAVPQVPGAPGIGTDTGVIDTSYFLGGRDLGQVKAYQIRTPPNLPATSFNFANSIGSITTLSAINGMSVTTGRLTSTHFGGDLSNMVITIAGPIKNLTLNGNVTGSSSINAVGINGNIGTLKIGGNLQGSITATRRITKATIAGNLTGNIQAPQIGTLKVNGLINGGNLAIHGNITLFQTKGDLGLPGETLTITGNAKTIKIGGNINADLTVSGNVGTLQVGRSIISGNTVDIGGVLNLLSVNADVQTAATVMAALVKKVKVRGVIDGMISLVK
jgi:hypothetical protein